ncbi:WD40/YVTN/BNR-like repeat-containing protein [Flavobacterium aciduliphilum]|uniref:Oxidoreductase n=1 Tax=Flavobacterium aciduliphilum TaxID=1101402 RepID=A0A328Y843_9FLAO|nr:oxidoreductase [Flavobacterium aciduliphilum]RAR70079.1 hypothetical protein CLV55_11368 [Flavobacterium aciduliphilum]
MKRLFILFLICFQSFVFSQTNLQSISYPKNISLDTLLTDVISIRAITVSPEFVWYAADKNRVGVINLKSGYKEEIKIEHDGLTLEFRSIAQTKKYIFILCVGTPALLFRLSKDLTQYDLVYREEHEKVFYDSMQFWNEQEGMAIGDPTDSCLSLIRTHDGGMTWNKLTCEKSPKIIEGEAAFASSNTNLISKKNCLWVVTGGKKARVFCSNKQGTIWTSFDTPIQQGSSMSGIFTADFYDKYHGCIAGGDYENPSDNLKNIAFTSNGGKTWSIPNNVLDFGYTSCVQYVPYSNGRQLLVVGSSGVFYTSDTGFTWRKVANDSSLFTIRFISKKVAIVAGKNKIVRLRLN